MLAAMLGVTVSAMLFSSALVVANETYVFWRQERLRITTLAEVVGMNAAASLLFSDQQTARATLATLKQERQIISARLLDSNGGLFARYDRPEELLRKGSLSEKGNASLLIEAAEDTFWDFDGDLVAAAPVMVDGQQVGTLVIQSDVSPLIERLRNLLTTKLVVMMGAILLALLLATKLQRTLTAPITHLAEVMRRVTTEGNYGLRGEKISNDELGELISGFNSMLEQVQLRDRELAQQGVVLARANEELVEANEEVRNFAYIVSHDLRAPLVSIKGFSVELATSLREFRELMAESIEKLPVAQHQEIELLLDTDIREALGFISSSVQRMDGQIAAILNLSRLGRRDLKMEEVKTASVVKGILDSLGHQIEAHHVHLDVAELPTILADRTAVEQIFGNLIDNALKYLLPERDGEIAIWSEVEPGGIIFHIRDNGRGIAPEDQGKVFELFRRVGTQDVKGDGMGLTYVKTLVKRHGGRIWIDSEFGVGSIFSFSLSQKNNGQGKATITLQKADQ
jgi:signal transduction histidine kinase